MAADWIKMRGDLLTHPKVVRMVSALKADKLRVIGGLHAVWCLFDAHTTDGELEGYTSEALDDYLGWPGFGSAMIKIDWLQENGESLTAPRFAEHNGQSAKRRATETERKRLARELAEPSAPNADKKRSREEKKREEKKEEGRRASRLPSDFEPTPEPEAEQGMDRRTELANFRDYWLSKPGKDGTKLDWQATWRQWARKAHRKPADVARMTVPMNPTALYVPERQRTPDELAANGARAAEARAQVDAAAKRMTA